MTGAAELADITIDREAGQLQLTFGDGSSGAIDLRELRAACPCAGCRSARDGGGTAWDPSNATSGAGVRGAELIGAWGLSITWDDGHSTGIYPLDSLVSWIRTGRATFTPDSGLGA